MPSQYIYIHNSLYNTANLVHTGVRRCLLWVEWLQAALTDGQRDRQMYDQYNEGVYGLAGISQHTPKWIHIYMDGFQVS